MSEEGYKILCLFFLSVTLWATNLIPLSITSLLVIAAIPLLGIMDTSTVYSYFGNKAVFFILGAFILSAAMIGCGLSARISLWVLETQGKNPRKLVTTIYLFGAVASCFMSEHAVAAMLYPIVFEIVHALKLQRGTSVLGKSLFFALAWGCIIGGETTALGGARVPLAMAILEKNTQGASGIGILQYTVLSLPHVLLMLVGGWLVLFFLFPPDLADISPAREVLHRKSQVMGKMSVQEVGIAIVMAITLFFWFGYGENLGIANIAIIAIVGLFVLNLIDWKTVEKHVNWAIILMYGGAICLGEVMSKTGAALWVAKKIFEGNVQSPMAFLLALAFLAMVFTTFMSNSAVIAILLPPALSLCQTYDINPAVATMAVILPSNFAFCLPVGTPASALAYSSRFIGMKEMAFSGAILCLIGMVSLSISMFFYWPLIGFN